MFERLTESGSGTPEVTGEITQGCNAKLDCVMNNKSTQQRQFTSSTRRSKAGGFYSPRAADAFSNLVDREMVAGGQLHRESGEELIGAEDTRVLLIAHHQFAIHRNANARQDESLIGRARGCRLMRQHGEREVCGEPRYGLTSEIGSMAAPWIGGRIRDNTRAHGVEMDVAHQLQQILIRIDENRPIASLKEVTGRRTLPLHVSCEAAGDSHHRPTERHVADLHQEMNVIGHPAVGVMEVTGKIAQRGDLKRKLMRYIRHYNKRLGR